MLPAQTHRSSDGIAKILAVNVDYSIRVHCIELFSVLLSPKTDPSHQKSGAVVLKLCYQAMDSPDIHLNVKLYLKKM